MYNPLVNDVSQLNDEQLSEKIRSLTRKYYIANNPEIKESVQTLLDIYVNEQTTRLLKKTDSNEEFNEYISIN